MNDIDKKSVSDALLKALKEEKLSAVKAASIIGIRYQYIHMIKNPMSWSRCPLKAWDIAHTWFHSGFSLSEWKVNKPAAQHARRISKEAPKGKASPQKSDAMDPKIAVRVLVFLKMKAEEYRKLADDFDKAAESFLNS